MFYIGVHGFFTDVFVVGSIRLKHRGYTLIWEDDRLCRDSVSLVLVTSFPSYPMVSFACIEISS
jgi:hypothetical protein